MGHLCRYRYKGRYCAHSAVHGRECQGEERCRVQPHRIVSWNDQNCSHERSYGLYCTKYQKFYCAGKDSCATPEAYMDSLVKFRMEGGRA
ncbi:MAG: hypothetical protein A4E32_01510 [Methanomassiliicoccales archaeon PtaU1.Bin124]|nr:MAG: hypothetical protein A4E32_01510 [Methanomassiliicoccales archaeon PtaU1.Bin124]